MSTDVMRPAPIPSALLQGYGALWVREHGGEIVTEDLGIGRLFTWCGPRGERVALPGRMYGIADMKGRGVGQCDLPAGVSVHLPPGVTTSSGVAHGVSHCLEAVDEESAWALLKRVGRQGVRRAQRENAEAVVVDDRCYHTLGTMKAARFNSPPPPPHWLSWLRETFGVDNVCLLGVRYGGETVAVVLSLRVEGYGMLLDGASDPAFLHLCPNNLCVWETIRQLVNSGCQYVDLGFSEMGAGDARFKGHMGGTAFTLWRHGP